MDYQFDVSDFKSYLKNKNPKYRVEGLTFWKTTIPIPIDLFNKIFDDSGIILSEYINQLTAAIIVFTEREGFEERFLISVDQLPTKALIKQKKMVIKWLEDVFEKNKSYQYFMLNVAEALSLDNITIDPEGITKALCHEGKKYCRLAYPKALKAYVSAYPLADAICTDNTDMFGNIVADRFGIYRSGFSDALATIFNALIDFKLICNSHETTVQRINLSIDNSGNNEYKLEKTQDGSLWEPNYTENHLVKINVEHPFIKTLPPQSTKHITDILYFLSEFEDSQFSDSQRKVLENMRQEVSKSLWIQYD